ncbi:MAG TPA: choice-of-anchor J domain-containing protein [Chitinophagaceae bacterium]|nr:choice-of-anchor J domain-containing protein [Chitinophagaceae bacterium]
MQPNFTLKNWGFLRRKGVIMALFLILFSGGLLKAQTITLSTSTDPTYNGLNTFGAVNSAVTFVIENTNGFPVVLKSVDCYFDPSAIGGGNGTIPTLWVSSSSLSGAPTIAGPTWTTVATGGPVTLTTAGYYNVLNGLTYSIPASTTLRFALQSSLGISYSGGGTGVPSTNTFTSNGVSMKVGDVQISGANVGYAGAFPSPTFNPRYFTGGVTIDISSAPCSGTPAPGNTVSSSNPVCPSSNFILSLQNPTSGTGVTYQWQSSPDGSAWSNIGGATNSTYSTSITTATYYRCNVTCSGNTGTSNPLQVTIAPPSSCYCAAGATSTSFEKISRVQFNTIDNSSTSTAGYEDFTSITTTVIKGQVLPMTVTISTAFSTDQVLVWIDFNQNGNFSDPGEQVWVSSAGLGPHTGNITISPTALTGSTRMRIRMHDSGLGPNSTPCGNSTYGQVEDYTVNIQPCVPIAITGAPASTSIACGSNATFTVTATGSAPIYSWEYRVNSSSTWQVVPNSGIYSGANSATLTLTNVPATYSGYQYRGLVSGACSAVDFSGIATLTVTPIIPIVNPSSATICTGSIQQLTLTNTLGNADLITEGFNSVSPLPTGWASQNNSSPAGTTGWFQGNTGVFSAQSGPADSYIAANYQNTSGVGTISNWLFTPTLNIKNGDVLKFYTRTVDAPAFPDRLELRMSTNGSSTNVGATATSVGDYTTLLLTVNSSLTTSGYPNTWTQYTATVSGVTGTVSGRFAFRYYVTGGGPSGANSDFIGIDNVVFTSSGGPAQGVWTGNLSTMWTNAAATTPYVAGSLATTIYVNPTVTSNYNVSFTTLTPCTSAVTTVPVNVVNPVTSVVSPTNKSVCVGGNTSFSVSASGGPITYQWQVSVDGGVTWSNIAGATTTTLNLTGVTQLMNNNRYRAVLTAAPCVGSTTSGVAVLTVNALPNVTITASDISLAPGQTSTITGSSSPAAASGGWSWTLNGSGISGNGNTQTLNVDGMGVYQATVTDVNGCVNTSNELEIGAEASDRLWIYPNPTAGSFQVRLYYDSDVAEKRVITIYNMQGQSIMSKEFTLANLTPPYLQMDFDLSHMARGTYVVKVAHKYTGKVVSGLVLVQ